MECLNIEYNLIQLKYIYVRIMVCKFMRGQNLGGKML